MNFSNYEPTPDELAILDKGFKFCPTPKKPDCLKLEVDINEFVRKIELTSFFSYSTRNNQPEEILIQKKSDYRAPESKDPLLCSMVNHIKAYAKTLYNQPVPTVYDNVTPRERDAMFSLKNNLNIVITSVDKGSAIVILNRSDYIIK